MMPWTRMIRHEKKRAVPAVLHHALLVAFGLAMIYPLLWMLFGSFKETSDIFSESLLIVPRKFVWENIAVALRGIPPYTLVLFMKNSFVLTSLTVLGTLLSCSLAAFGFSRVRFPLSRLLFIVVLATMMLPRQVVLIPQYILFTKLKWVNTFLPIVVPAFLAQASGGFFIFMLVQFIRGIPIELDDSARMDGAGFLRIYYYLILPLSKSALFAVAIFSFVWTWDDFLSQLIYINNNLLYTVALGLRMFMDNTGIINWGALFAASLISITPVVLLFFLAQRYFVEGVTMTGLKG